MTPEFIDLITEGMKYIIAALLSGGSASLLTWRTATAQAKATEADAQMTLAEARRIAQQAEIDRERYQDERHAAINLRMTGIHDEYQELIAKLNQTVDRKEDVIRNLSTRLQESNVQQDKLRDAMAQAAITDREKFGDLLTRFEGLGDDLEALLELVKDNDA